MGDKPRDALQCWGCEEGHLFLNFPHQKGSDKHVHNIQEVEIIGTVARIVPRIIVSLEDHKGYY